MRQKCKKGIHEWVHDPKAIVVNSWDYGKVRIKTGEPETKCRFCGTPKPD